MGNNGYYVINIYFGRVSFRLMRANSNPEIHFLITKTLVVQVPVENAVSNDCLQYCFVE